MSVSRITITLIGWPGRWVLRSSLYIINLFTFSVLALREWSHNNRLLDSKSYGTSIAQIIFTGIDALPTITLLGLATSFVFTFRLITIVESVGATDDLLDLLVMVIGMEMAPFIAAIILISRTGSAIVIDLGNMKLHGEIEGIELLGININEYLIAPRIIGTAISQLVISVYFTVVALTVGIILSGLLNSPSHFAYLNGIGTAFTSYLVLTFVIKNLLFGFIIGATACYNGLRVRTSPTEVPQQATRSIVTSLVFIFIIDGLLALAFI